MMLGRQPLCPVKRPPCAYNNASAFCAPLLCFARRYSWQAKRAKELMRNKELWQRRVAYLQQEASAEQQR